MTGWYVLSFLSWALGSFISLRLFPPLQDHERAWGNPIDVPLPEGDPLAASGQKLYLSRSVPDASQKDTSRPKAFKNRVTHWWDMSQIYGTDAETNRRIRTGKDGKLVIAENGLLPFDSDGMEITGFKDNW